MQLVMLTNMLLCHNEDAFTRQLFIQVSDRRRATRSRHLTFFVFFSHTVSCRSARTLDC